jgi:hypothetical protein
VVGVGHGGGGGDGQVQGWQPCVLAAGAVSCGGLLVPCADGGWQGVWQGCAGGWGQAEAQGRSVW